jgi:hypothetical protein
MTTIDLSFINNLSHFSSDPILSCSEVTQQFHHDVPATFQMPMKMMVTIPNNITI